MGDQMRVALPAQCTCKQGATDKDKCYRCGWAVASTTELAPGDRVWYEPSPGARFAGIVAGEGMHSGTSRVLMSSAYWWWKDRKPRTENIDVVTARLIRRTCSYPFDVELELLSEIPRRSW